MTVVARTLGKLCVLGLLAVWVGVMANDASGQTTTKKRAVRAESPRQLVARTAAQPVGFVPKHMKGATLSAMEPDVEIVDGGTYYEDASTGDLVIGQEAPMAGSCGAGGGCMGGTCVDGSCAECCLVPCGMLPVGNLELSFGVQGFTGPVNYQNGSGSGSFGFNEGLNWGVPIPGFQCLGGQIGFRAVHSNFAGAEFTNDSRNQTFVTAGLFRRVDVGLQGGVVVDYLSDSWYHDADFLNIRGELSWVTCGTHDIGFWFTNGTRTATEPGVLGALETWESTDLYACFYRQKFGPCLESEARMFAGWSNQSDGLIGADVRLPLADAWALEGGFSYLIPEEGDGRGALAGHAQESWNVGIGVVWYPGRLWGHDNKYYGPLLPVAHNGLFMIDRQ
ncbi:MAG: hypothetical protein H8E44_27875 [Planctomycetes bacterium]|nr:hypothetical protein [Planctomycetota bacterium]MBL7039326.1 hypothetical protein [Pirellulaceae bacterium]